MMVTDYLPTENCNWELVIIKSIKSTANVAQKSKNHKKVLLSSLAQAKPKQYTEQYEQRNILVSIPKQKAQKGKWWQAKKKLFHQKSSQIFIILFGKFFFFLLAFLRINSKCIMLCIFIASTNKQWVEHTHPTREKIGCFELQWFVFDVYIE